MTSSNQYNFSPSNGEMVLAALERIQVRGPSVRQEHLMTARREINFLMAGWSNKSPNLWEVTLRSQALTQGAATYSINPNTVMMLDVVISLDNGTSDQTDRLITPLSRTDYMSIANKSTQGFPTSFWFDRLLSPTVTLWPVPDGNGPYTLNYYCCTQMQDANLQSGETPDIPYLFLDAMVADLSYRLARVYNPQLEAMRKSDAAEAWVIAAAQNTENTPLSIAPSIGGYYRR